MSEEREIKPDLSTQSAGPSQYDPATPAKPKGGKLMLVVSSPDGQQIKIGIKSTSTFEKMFKAAADRFGLNQTMIRFLYDGQRLRPDQTPEEFDMQDDDMIDMQVQQIGGALFLLMH
ncbi:ubiquitin-like protein [Serendipita vermifera]|nr:ubiquitin-like protein [Serendipita vermifera]